LNIFVGLVGNLGWLAVALVWKKWSLLVVQVVIALLYISGAIKAVWP
jgi:ABC-type siderophore export system fused ATPase/permease subunit